jgi:outer membrane protein
MKDCFFLTRALLLVFLFSIFLSNDIQAQNEPWSLDDCITYAIENNIQIKQSELNSNATEVDLLQTKLSLLPNLNVGTSYSYSWGRRLDQSINEYVESETQQGNAGIDANVTIFGGFQKMNSIKKGKIDFLVSKYDAQKMRDDISLMITQAYLSILFNRELLKVALDQVEITKIQIERTSKLVEAGTLPQGSLLEVEAQASAEEINVINYENSLNLAYLDLLQLLDIPAGSDFEIFIPDVPEIPEAELAELNTIYQLALENQPVMKSAELSLESAQKGVVISKGRMSPTLNLVGGWGTNYSNNFLNFDPTDPDFGEIIPFGEQFKNNQSRYMGLNLSIPIFNAYQVTSNINRAKINAANAEYNYDLTKNSLRKEIEQAYNDAQSSYKTYLATNRSLESFQESFRYTEQRFNVGMANSVDYNIAKSQVTAAESELIRSRYDYLFKTKILDFYMGKPLTLDQ